jgi:hypothetical protein
MMARGSVHHMSRDKQTSIGENEDENLREAVQYRGLISFGAAFSVVAERRLRILHFYTPTAANAF